MSDLELKKIYQKFEETVNRPLVWKKKLSALLIGYERPPLRSLQSLLATGEKCGIGTPELKDLKQFVGSINSLVDEASKILQRRRKPTGRRHSDQFFENPDITPSLDYVKELIAKMKSMAFDSPEIRMMEALAEDAMLIENKAQQLLESFKFNMQEARKLFDEGVLIGLKLPYLNNLENQIKKSEWLKRAEIAVEESLDLIDLNQLIEESSILQISHGDTSLLAKLESRKALGHNWSQLAQYYISNGVQQLEEYEDILNINKWPVTSKDLLSEIRKRHSEAKKWFSICQTIASDLLVKVNDQNSLENQREIISHDIPQTSNVCKRTKYELRSLFDESLSLKLRLPVVSIINEELTKVAEWELKCKHMFQRPTSYPVLDSVELLSGVLLTIKNNTGEIGLKGYCLCRSKEAGFMVIMIF